MKAMGMSSGFGPFSLEAVVIGTLGSALGVGMGVLVGDLVSRALSTSILSGLPGLTLLSFDAVGMLAITGLVVAIAFLAGTFPAARAARAARADLVQSLRYE